MTLGPVFGDPTAWSRWNSSCYTSCISNIEHLLIRGIGQTHKECRSSAIIILEIEFVVLFLSTSPSDSIGQIVLIKEFWTKVDERIASARRVFITSISVYRARLTITRQSLYTPTRNSRMMESAYLPSQVCGQYLSGSSHRTLM